MHTGGVGVDGQTIVAGEKKDECQAPCQGFKQIKVMQEYIFSMKKYEV